MAAADEKQSNNRFEEVDETEKYPLLIRIYGALGIVARVVQVVTFIRAALAVFLLQRTTKSRSR